MACCEPGRKKKDGFDEWEIESAARNLREAGEVRQKPKLHKLALDHLEKEKIAIEVAQKQDVIITKAEKNLKGVFGEDD